MYNIGKKSAEEDRCLWKEAESRADLKWQYTSKIFHDKLIAANKRQSLSRVGGCIDSVPMEEFWGILKSEMYYISESLLRVTI